MKKLITTFLLFSFFLTGSVYADQDNSETLKKSLENLQGKERVDRLNELSAKVLQDNTVEANQYATEAVKLAGKLDYQRGEATACDNLGMVYLSKNDYTNAMKQFVNGLKIRNELDDQKGIATSKNNIGWVFYLQENINSALSNLKTALEIRMNIKDVGGAAETHEKLGYVYLFKKLYGKAREHYGMAMELRIEMDQLTMAAEIASHLGKIARDMGDHEGALAYYRQSLDLNRSTNDLERIGNDFNNIALVYLSQASTSAFDKEEFLEEALEANHSAFQIRQEVGDKLKLAESYQNYGSIYIGMGEEEKGIENLEYSAALLKEIGPKSGTQFIIKNISDDYLALNDYKNAYEYQAKYSEFRDIIYTNQKSKELLDLTTKYESEFAAEKQAQKIAVLEKEQDFNAKMNYFLMGMIGLGILLGMVLFNSYKQKQRDNRLLRNKNEEIHRQKAEIDHKNIELEEKHASLDILNQKLVKEMAERESIEQSSFARDRFLATMSHEMRTPMNIIIGLTHLLLSEDPREDQVEHLRTLQFSANNLVVFINDVLDFSKIEAGKLTLENREFNPKDTLDEIEKRHALPAKDKGLALICNYDTKIPDMLMGDSARLNQILTNLTSNAIKFTNEGIVSLNMQLDSLNKNEATLLITVEDTGEGIEPERLEEMFRKFSRNTSEDMYDGYATSGLGLAITKRLVDLQNGKIEVESIPGQGTTFTVILPYKIYQGSQNNKKSIIKEPKSYEELAGNKILLVEDNKINQLVVAKLLRKLGMEVITADNGLEALDAFSVQYFDLVLMDIQMPKMDGYRATAEIRKSTDPRKRDVPIIALTASAFLTEKEKAKLFGMNDHVGKPFGPEDLIEKINSCLMVYKT